MANEAGDNEEIQSINAKPFRTRIDRVHFEGIERTKVDILKELVKPIFKTNNLIDVLHNIKLVRRNLVELGLFRDVKVSIDESQNKLAVSENDRTDLDIVFDVQETRRYAGGIFTSASNNQAMLTFELKSPNVFGRGEEFRGQFEQSYKYFSSWNATFSKPFINSYSPVLEITALQSSKDALWSHYKELDRGILCDLSLKLKPKHSLFFRVENMWRNLSIIDNKNALNILDQFGHSLKSSVSQTYVYDTRNNPVLPNSGFMFKIFNEYAGFVKDGVSFLKSEAEVQHTLSLLNLRSSFKVGLLKKFGNLSITDKLFLGGPLNLRGFKMNGVGPHVNDSAIGAFAYWIAGMHIYYPLPLMNAYKENIRLQTFVNAGNIYESANPLDLVNSQYLLKDIRMSCGIGLAMSLSNVRFEINYCLPFKSQENDKKQDGFQFGIGIQYT